MLRGHLAGTRCYPGSPLPVAAAGVPAAEHFHGHPSAAVKHSNYFPIFLHNNPAPVQPHYEQCQRGIYDFSPMVTENQKGNLPAAFGSPASDLQFPPERRAAVPQWVHRGLPTL